MTKHPLPLNQLAGTHGCLPLHASRERQHDERVGLVCHQKVTSDRHRLLVGARRFMSQPSSAVAINGRRPGHCAADSLWPATPGCAQSSDRDRDPRPPPGARARQSRDQGARCSPERTAGSTRDSRRAAAAASPRDGRAIPAEGDDASIRPWSTQKPARRPPRRSEASSTPSS
jgi:hypothetical protein